VSEDGWTLRAAAAALGVSEPTARKWLRRYQREGVRGLADRSSAPRRVANRTAAEWVWLIEQLRRWRLTGVEIAVALRLPLSTVSRWLQRLELGRLARLDPPEPANRYERRHPGELVHIDIKKLGAFARPGHRVNGDRRTRTRGVGWEYVYVCVDDTTRLAYVEVLENERAVTAVGFLRRAVAFYRRHGVRVRRVMTDNGSPFVSRLHRAVCRELRIRHLRTRPYRPRTNGKAERFIRTLLAEWAYRRPYGNSAERRAALAPWVDYYNLRRPHGALRHHPPVDRLHALQRGSRRNNVLRIYT
jgi:transposase InsO family protein